LGELHAALDELLAGTGTGTGAVGQRAGAGDRPAGAGELHAGLDGLLAGAGGQQAASGGRQAVEDAASLDASLPGVEELAHSTPPAGAGDGRVPAIDGMDPGDDALLRETQQLLSTSLTFAGGPTEVAERFRTALVPACPGLLPKLPGDDRTQVMMLARGLTWLVHHLDQPPLVVSGCGQLGAALAVCGVEAERLQLVGAALVEAIRAGMPAGAWRQDFELAWRSTWQHVHEWIGHGAATIGDEAPIWTAEVMSHELRRPDLAVLRLRPYLPMPFRPGQYARVEVGELPGIWRPYSLAGAPHRDDLVEVHVRAKTVNGVSGTLVYRTKAGDRVHLSPAEGEMALSELPDRPVLMIAGDTGVAPLKALLTELADTGDPRSAGLFWGVRNLVELYDIDDVAEIARSAKRATVVPVVSEGDPGPYASGLVTDAVAAYGEWSDHEVYLAGPPMMLAATSAALYQLGVAPARVHHDAPE
jgi:NAD(P)H-flavin reductase